MFQVANLGGYSARDRIESCTRKTLGRRKNQTTVYYATPPKKNNVRKVDNSHKKKEVWQKEVGHMQNTHSPITSDSTAVNFPSSLGMDPAIWLASFRAQNRKKKLIKFSTFRSTCSKGFWTRLTSIQSDEIG